MADEPESTATETTEGGSLATGGETETPAAPAPTDWRGTLPPELQTDKTLSQIKDIPTLAKAYVDAQKMVGGSIRLPGEKATPEEREKALGTIYDKLGRPKTPDEYQVQRPSIPEGVTWDDGAEKMMLSEMHQAGLNTAQVQRTFDAYGRILDAQVKGFLERNKAGEAETSKVLQQEWGPAYKNNLALVHRAVGTLGDEALHNALDRTGLGNHPVIIRAFLALAEQGVEDGIIAGDVDGVGSIEMAKAERDRILNDKTHPYWKGDEEATQKMHGLNKIIHGTKTVATIG